MADTAIHSFRPSGTRESQLKKSLLIALALLVLPFSLLISSGTANAAVETEKSLNARLLTDAELKAALASNGITLDFSEGGLEIRDSDVNLPDMVASGRLWGTNDGSGLVDILVSYKDGRAIPADMRDSILKGEVAKGFLEGAGAYSKINLLDGQQLLSPNDILNRFEGTDADGKVEQVAVVSFIRGNIFGIVLYATADNQLGEVTSAFGYQTTKLPD
jgi:hypothetical protein